MLDKLFKKIKLSKIIFFVCAFLMTFSIFFFFTKVLKWEKRWDFDATPSFFDLIFGNAWSGTDKNDWPILAGMVVLFIFQIALIATCLSISVLLIINKIKQHTAICILCGIAVVAFICGVISFLPQLMIARKYIYPEFGEYIPYKYEMKLAYGAYLYGITMLLASCGSVGAFILDHYNK